MYVAYFPIMEYKLHPLGAMAAPDRVRDGLHAGVGATT
jgi:hypothetical protein